MTNNENWVKNNSEVETEEKENGAVVLTGAAEEKIVEDENTSDPEIHHRIRPTRMRMEITTMIMTKRIIRPQILPMTVRTIMTMIPMRKRHIKAKNLVDYYTPKLKNIVSIISLLIGIGIGITAFFTHQWLAVPGAVLFAIIGLIIGNCNN